MPIKPKYPKDLPPLPVPLPDIAPHVYYQAHYFIGSRRVSALDTRAKMARYAQRCRDSVDADQTTSRAFVVEERERVKKYAAELLKLLEGPASLRTVACALRLGEAVGFWRWAQEHEKADEDNKLLQMTQRALQCLTPEAPLGRAVRAGGHEGARPKTIGDDELVLMLNEQPRSQSWTKATNNIAGKGAGKAGIGGRQIRTQLENHPVHKEFIGK